ncbi:UNVERIFIED_CONTAM: hypothetical protein NY100_16925, partial [Prevotella sp. 15_C9]
ITVISDLGHCFLTMRSNHKERHIVKSICLSYFQIEPVCHRRKWHYGKCQEQIRKVLINNGS